MFYLGFFLLKLISWLLALVPRRLFMVLGRALGALLHAVHFREKVVVENLERAFPEKSKEEKSRLVKAQYGNLGILFLEMFRSFYRFDRFVERFSDVEGEEHLRAAMAKGKGVFVMSAHLGNWEVLTASGPAIFGTDVTMVTKVLKPAWLHRAIDVTRSLMRVKMACEPKTMQGILRAVKKQELIGWVMDQYTGAPVGARVPFFGVPVGSHTALAAIALRTGVPVLPALSYRKPNGRFTIRFEPEFPLLQGADTDTSVILNTANYVKHTEGWVREFPEQWMWIHRRWKGDLSPLPPHSPGEMLR